LPSSTAAGLKNAKAAPCWPLPRKFRAKARESASAAYPPESGFTPMATSGGSKEVWVTQFTVAAAISPLPFFAVST